MNNRSHASRAEKHQRKLDAGSLANRFPEVANIVVSMVYHQRGMKQTIARTVNFVPSSYALFSVDCLNKDCSEGGFDLTTVIVNMVRSHRGSTRGELACIGGPTENHSSIEYEVAIQYAQ